MLAPIRRASRGTSYQCGDVGSDGPHFSQVGFVAGAVHLSAQLQRENGYRGALWRPYLQGGNPHNGHLQSGRS